MLDNVRNFKKNICNLDDLQNIADCKNLTFKTKDGKVYPYHVLLELFAKQEFTNILKHSPVKGSHVGEIGDHMLTNVDAKIRNAFHKNLSMAKALKGILLSPLSMIGKFIYAKVLSDKKMVDKILSDGLYHFTTLEGAQKIIESGYIKASDCFSSYGSKKAFFFAGQPSFEKVAMNLSGFHIKHVAIKLDIQEGELNQFVYRNFSEQAIASSGDFHFDPARAKIVYMGLQEEKETLVYKEIPKEEFDTYLSDFPSNKISLTLNKLKTFLIGMSGEYTSLLRTVDQLKKYMEARNQAFDENMEEVLQLAREMMEEKKRYDDFSADASKQQEIENYRKLDFMVRRSQVLPASSDFVKREREFGSDTNLDSDFDVSHKMR